MSQNLNPPSRIFDFYRLEDRILLSANGPDADSEAAGANQLNDLSLFDQQLFAEAEPMGPQNQTSRPMQPDRLVQDIANDPESDQDANVETEGASENQDAPSEESSANLVTEASSPELDALRLEILFVDSQVKDADILLEGLRNQASETTRWLIVQIDANEDGIAKISSTLNDLQGVDAVHVVSHGDGQGIQLGNTWLDQETADQQASEISAWRQALDANADLLVYGCDLASTEAGRALLESLRSYCDCDIAASDDITGHESLDGDWDLEYSLGVLEASLAFSEAAQSDWQGTLSGAAPVANPNSYFVEENTTLNVPATSSFTSSDVSTAVSEPNTVYAIDVDGDGDVDVLSSSENDNTIAWHENDGAENFTKHTISNTVSGASSVYAEDVDGDGDIDVLSTADVGGAVYWHENDGSENFTQRTVTNSLNNSKSVSAIDLDSDGDMDVLVVGAGDNMVAWYENDGSENFTQRAISLTALTASSAYAIDVDADGDLDVLSASSLDDKIAWYENDGSENFTTHVVTTSADGASSVYALDVDGDSDIDFLSSSVNDDTIAWYENDGSENFTTHTITTSADGAQSVYAVDVDADGDIDVLSASATDNTVAWYENDGSENFTTRAITTSATSAYSVYATDVDGDGDMDVLSTSLFGNAVTWYENVTAILANDTDPESDPLTAVLVTGPSHAASFTLNGDGSFDYTPVANFDRVDTFIYKVNDGTSDSNVTTVTLTIGNYDPRLVYIGPDSYDVSAAVYAGVGEEFSVAGEEPSPAGVTFSSDGTKMFILGYDNDEVVEYNLGTAWDVSTAIHAGAGEEFYIGSEESIPHKVRFSSDGTKMFVVGFDDDAIVEYTLGKAWDVSTAVYAGAGEEFYVGGQETYPRDVVFNLDGTKMFIVGNNDDAVVEYDLGTAWDVSTAVYAGAGEEFYVGGEGAGALGLAFNVNGTKMFIAGNVSNTIFEYTLGTAWDVSTAVYAGAGETLGVGSEESSLFGIAFNSNGSKVFAVGPTDDSVVEYTIDPGNFTETGANDGSVSGSITIVLTDDTFQDIDGDDLLDIGTEVTINNVPAGLTAVLSLSENDTLATLTFTGNASSHLDADDVAALSFVFQNAAFTGGDASVVNNSGDGSAYDPGVGIDFDDSNSPVQSTIEGANLAYTENDGPVAITSTLAIADSDDTNIESATIQITGNYANGEDVLAFTDASPISGSWNAGTGTLTLTGSDTLANYQAALRSITFENTSETPSTLTRTISFKVNDGDTDSNTLTRDIDLTAVNDAPVANPNSYTLVEDNALTTTPLQSFSAKQVIDNTVFADLTTTADLDGDGDLDILFTESYDNTVAWFENTDGLGTFGAKQVISNIANEVYSVTAADLDGDGDLDVLAASYSDDTVIWYENTDGLGTFGTEQVINNTTDGANSVEAADLDGDGDLDVLAASDNDDTVAWFENTDGLGTFGTKQVITNAAGGAHWIATADLDGDGDLDVLAAAFYDDTVSWFENTDGLGTFGTEQVIDNAANGASSVTAADLDGDGDLDVLATSRLDDTVAWFENTDGLGTFGTEQVITNTADGAESVTAADLDGDGDLDVLAASTSDNTVAWFENTDGLGNFGTEQTITITSGLESATAADLDGDGDLDVLESRMTWFENLPAGVLPNDTDLENDPLTALLVTDVSNGTLGLNADGSFTYTPDANFNGLDSFTYKANDGTTDSNIVTVTLNVTPVNDAPVQSTIEGANLAYTENDGPVAITSTLAIADVDDTNIESAVIQITGNYANGEDVLAFTDASPISGSWNAGTGTLTLTGSDTLANYQAALRSITFENTSETPSTLTRTISFKVNDGDTDSNTLTRDIDLTAVNDAPVQSTIEGTNLAYTENDGAVAITSTLAIADPDDTNIESAVIQITGNYANGEDVLAFTDASPISGSWNAGTGTLTLTGSDTLANYQAALRSVTYENTSNNPSALTRTVSFTVNDGDTHSNLLTRDINVTAVYNATLTYLGPDAYSPSDANYAGSGEELKIGGEEGQPSDLVFSSDGTKMFTIGNNRKMVIEYALGTAWDASTAVHAGTSEEFYIGAQEGFPKGLAFSANGTKMFVVGTSGDAVVEYTLGTAWDVSTAVYDGAGEEFYVGAEEDAPQGITFSADGTKMFIIGSGDDSVVEYILGTAWDVSTAVYAGVGEELYVGAEENGPTGILFSPDGTTLFILGFNGDAIVEYSLGTAWDVSTATYAGAGEEFLVGGQEGAAQGFAFRSDGTKMFVIGWFDDAVVEYTLGTAWDVSTAVYAGADEEFLVGGLEFAPTDITFSSDGTKMFIVGNNDDAVVEYDLGTAWDASTAVHTGTAEEFYVGSQESFVEAIAFSLDGTKMFAVGWNSDVISEYALGSAWDVSTAVYAGIGEAFYVGSEEAVSTGVAFKTDGTKMFIVGSNDDSVVEYNLGTAWDVSTAVYAGSGEEFSVGSVQNNPSGLVFHPDGTKMFIVRDSLVGGSDDVIVEYNLGTAWDVSTAVYAGPSKELFVGGQETSPTGLAFDSGGTKMFVVGTNHRHVVEYTIDPGVAFVESSSTPGAVTGSLTIVLAGDTFQDIDGDDILDLGTEVTIGNVPAGLTAVVTLSAGDTQATLTFTGNATNHENIHDVTDLTFTFDDSAFTNNLADDVVNATGPYSSGQGIDFFSSPVQSAIEGTNLAYLENDGPVNITSSIAISDFDDTNIESATIQITGNYVNGEDVLDFTNSVSISGFWNAGTGTLTLTGTDTLANYQTALQSVTYENIDDDPTALTRTIQFTVNDGDNNSNPLTRDIEITPENDAPIAISNGTSLNEGDTGIVLTSAMLNAIDPDDDPTGLTYFVTSDVNHGNLRLNGTLLNNGDTFTQDDINAGRVTYDHDDSETTTDHFDFVLADGQEDDAVTDPGTFSFTINPVNDNAATPLVDNDTNPQVVDENASLGTTVGLTLFSQDLDAGDTINYTLDDNDGGRFAIDTNTGIVTVNGDIDREADGPNRSITVRATSSDGSFQTQAYSIAINDLDEFDVSPIVDSDPSADTVDENSSNGTTVGVTALAIDADSTNNTVTYALTDDATGRFAIDSNTGLITVLDGTRLDHETNPFHDLTVTASSTDGSLQNTVIRILVADLNESPIIGANTGATLDEGGSITITNSMLRADDQDDSGTGLTYTLSTPPNGGQLERASNPGLAITSFTQQDIDSGQLVYVHAAGEVPTDSFGFIVADGGEDGAITASGTFNLTILPVNDAPSGANNTVVLNEDTTYTFQVGDFGFSDVDGHAFQAIHIGTLSSNGSLRYSGGLVTAGDVISAADIAAGKLSFTPDLNQFGNNYANFTFAVQDDGGLIRGGQDTDPTNRLITLDVLAVNDTPVANSETYSTAVSDTLTVDVPGLLANDSDIDGDPLTALLAKAPDHGTLVLNGNGSFTYTPDNGFIGTDSFEYQASDGTLSSLPIEITINVTNAVEVTNPNTTTTETETENTDESEEENTEETETPPDTLITESLPAETSQPETASNQTDPEVIPGPVGRETTSSKASRFVPDQEEGSDSTADSGLSGKSRIGSTLAWEKLWIQELNDRAFRSDLASVFVWADNSTTDQISGQDDMDLANIATGTAVVGTSLASIGYAVSLARNATFVMTLLTGLPTWKMIDPATLVEVVHGQRQRQATLQDDSDLNGIL